MRQKVFAKWENWQKNLVVLWFGSFMTGVGASLIAPFLSLYIDSLGDFTKRELSFQSGLIYASTYLMTAIVSPLWGKLADQKGRKLMLLRASLGMSISIFLMGFVTTAWQLLLLRLLLGAFSGFTSNSIALMAIETPKEKSGQVLGTLATGTVAGTLLGPLFGGIIVLHTGYRATFWLTGLILFLVFWLTLFLVKEKKIELSPKSASQTEQTIRTLPAAKIILGMFLTTLILQLTDKSISPVLSLYVRELVKTPAAVSIFSGVIASAPGIVMLVVAPIFGRLGDKWGQKKILLLGLVVSFTIYLLLGFTQNIWQVVVLRLFIGVSDSALSPSVQAILSKNTPQAITGRVFSYNQTMQSIGAVGGPLMGSLVSGFLDYRYVFFFAAAVIMINLMNYRFTFTKSSHRKQEI